MNEKMRIMRSVPRPFYVIGHNTNTIGEVREALECGANALEPDVNVFSNSMDVLCISHLEGDDDAPTLQKFLMDLHEVAVQDDRLSLIIFDCKSAVAKPEHGLTILRAIRSYLTHDLDLNIILSVSDMDHAPIFDLVKDQLGPREGLMIDEHTDPKDISDYFKKQGVENACFGNGISIPPISITGPNVLPSMERACALRAAHGKPVFICVWTVNEERLQEECIHIGVDGIICDDITELLEKLNKPAFKNLVRLANRADNPFAPLNQAYSLCIHTKDRYMAGTDAHIKIILTGKNGSSDITVDSSFRAKMERNRTNYVTLPSADLGELISVTVERDNRGNAPDWWLDQVVVESSLYGVSKKAVFDREIHNNGSFTQALE